MSELIIPRQILDEMLAHCRGGYPSEACGILAGRENKVSRIYRMTNTEKSPVSYQLDSKEHIEVIRDMRENNLSMVGIFHSHPASQAYPSPKDVSLAFYEDAVYVIVSLAGKEPQVKAFSIMQGEISEAAIIVEGKPQELS
jgi:proteasome lid subunit RPN8/RPN11